MTTFAALEAGLGRRFSWPIITANSGAIFAWREPLRRYARAAAWDDGAQRGYPPASSDTSPPPFVVRHVVLLLVPHTSARSLLVTPQRA
jgi:hypothetical protein